MTRRDQSRSSRRYQRLGVLMNTAIKVRPKMDASVMIVKARRTNILVTCPLARVLKLGSASSPEVDEPHHSASTRVFRPTRLLSPVARGNQRCRRLRARVQAAVACPLPDATPSPSDRTVDVHANLRPQSDAESVELISGLLDDPEIRPEMRIPILKRADGNPLYVEEFLRLLKDRDLLFEEGGAWVLRPGSELPLPGPIHSLLAARLDTLSPGQKAMLSDAAVAGKVFWAGAVAARWVITNSRTSAPRCVSSPGRNLCGSPHAYPCKTSPSMRSGTCLPGMSHTDRRTNPRA